MGCGRARKDQSENEPKLSGRALSSNPSPPMCSTRLLPAYLRTSIYHALIDSAAGEQGARRTAMKSATDNANEMVETLTQIVQPRAPGRHHHRRSSEIVGGAAALED